MVVRRVCVCVCACVCVCVCARVAPASPPCSASDPWTALPAGSRRGSTGGCRPVRSSCSARAAGAAGAPATAATPLCTAPPACRTRPKASAAGRPRRRARASGSRPARPASPPRPAPPLCCLSLSHGRLGCTTHRILKQPLETLVCPCLEAEDQGGPAHGHAAGERTAGEVARCAQAPGRRPALGWSGGRDLKLQSPVVPTAHLQNATAAFTASRS